MRNIKLVLAYDGTDYCGWQRQKAEPTIQGVIEQKLAIMTREEIVLHGAGRTDAGVHALGMVANFKTNSLIPVGGFRKGLNSLLPSAVRVRSATEEDLAFHARKSAISKTYVYNIVTGDLQLPTDRFYTAHYNCVLDIEAIRSCLVFLVGEHDFSSFEASGSRDRSTVSGSGAVRKVFAAEFNQDRDDMNLCRFVITGNGFLRHMVRNIVGTLIDIGCGKRTAGDFKEIIMARDRSAAGPTAPATGLFLKEIFY